MSGRTRCMRWVGLVLFVFLLTAANAYAKVHAQTVTYQLGDLILEGYLAYDDAAKAKRPGILIIHEWTGVGPYVKKRAEQLAGLGYVAFAADIYGKGIRPQDAQEAAQEAAMYRADRDLMRERAKAGLQELRKQKVVDTGRIAVIGYCFGGGAALELARSGADIKGVVSFHGNLDTPNPEDAKNIKAKVLVLHGADDPHVTPEQVAAFQKEMRDANVDWQMITYGNAVHSFTNPASGVDASTGSAYNKEADKRSWKAMREFFKEIFARS